MDHEVASAAASSNAASAAVGILKEEHKRPELVAVLALHVDDLKGAARKEEREKTLAALEERFGKLKRF